MTRRIYLALDNMTLDQACSIVRLIGNRIEGVKIHALYDLYGHEGVSLLRRAGAQNVWVDHKIYDTPYAAGLRAKALFRNGADIISVHAQGRQDMIEAAVASGAKIYTVTNLTSFTEEQIAQNSSNSMYTDLVRMVNETVNAGAHGIICATHEINQISGMSFSQNLRRIVPGPRLPGVDVHDHKWTGTPKEAFNGGATDIVVGREITLATDPVHALNNLERQLAEDA